MFKKIVVIAASAAFLLGAAAGAHASPLSPTALKACQHSHLMLTVCASGGHYTKVGGQRVFMLNQGAQGVVPPGSAHVSALGWQYLSNLGNVHCLSKFGLQSNWTGMYICNLSANQTWDVFVWNNNGWGFLNKGNSNCLNNRYGRLSNYNYQITYQCQNVYNERYILYATGGGFRMEAVRATELQGANLSSGYCVSSYGIEQEGQPAELANCNWGANQTWGRV